ncbi:MAG: ankyrin repeat domain-containing protein [Bacteroidia bacterium]|nr:ankyrin repeat domain-containing protein [Bacteroidia bacterium]
MIKRSLFLTIILTAFAICTFADELVDKYVTAAAKGEYSKVVSFVKKGVAIDGKNQARWTALAYACKYNHEDIAKYLVENGANVNETVNTGSTPLAVALLAGNFGIADYLIQHKADINKPDMMGMSPLMWAVKDGNLKIVTYLVEHGAKVNAVNSNGRSVIEMAMVADVKDYLKSKGGKTSAELMKE